LPASLALCSLAIGYNGTIFAYGQTGSGKSWSMMGADQPEELRGIIPQLNDSMFKRIQAAKAADENLEYMVTVSYLEIYQEVCIGFFFFLTFH